MPLSTSTLSRRLLTGAAGYKIGDIAFSQKDLGASFLPADARVVPPEATVLYEILGNSDRAATSDSPLSLVTTPGVPSGGYVFPFFAESPVTGTILFTSGSNQVHRSVDGGDSFTFNANAGLTGNVSDIICMDDGTFIVTALDTGAFFISADDGASFTSRTTALYNAVSAFRSARGYTSTNISANDFHVGGAVSDGANLYVTASFGTVGGNVISVIAASVDKGLNWTLCLANGTGGNSHRSTFIHKVTVQGAVYLLTFNRTYAVNTGQELVVALSYKPIGVNTTDCTISNTQQNNMPTRPKKLVEVSPDGVSIYFWAGDTRQISNNFAQSYGMSGMSIGGSGRNPSDQRRMRDGGFLGLYVFQNSTVFNVYAFYTAVYDASVGIGFRNIGPAVAHNSGTPPVVAAAFASKRLNVVFIFINGSTGGGGDLTARLYKLKPAKSVPSIPAPPTGKGSYYVKVK
jgi:hypothetical protein